MEQIAIIHFANYPKGQTRSCMAAVMKYTMQEKKTMWVDRQLVSGINCRPESVYDDFLRTKLLYHKEGGTMFYHMVQSFPAGEDVDPADAHAAALKLAEWFEDREVLVCTHVDRDHIHSHFLINSVNFEDGKKLHISQPELTQLRQRNDQVCMEFGLPVFRLQKREQVKSISGAEYHAAARGESWKFRLMNIIDECMKYARSREEFIALMRSEGYDVRWTDGRKSITYTTPEGKKCRDDRLHEEKYLKEVMEHEFAIRARLIAGGAEGPQPAGEHAAAENSSHGRGVVGAEHGGDGHGRNFGGAGHPSGGTGGAFAEAPGSETVGGAADRAQGVHGGAAENLQSDRTGWEEERAALFPSHQPAPPVPGLAVGHPDVGGVVCGLVRLVHALEHDQSPAPLMPRRRHGDHKALQAEREKKIALGHKEDDHEEEQTWEQTM